MKVCAFTSVKDGLARGCCILECVASLIHEVDEWWWADGFSSDGTWELLQKIAGVNPKIKLMQEAWMKSSPCGEAIAEAFNIPLNKCDGQVAWEVQADEVYEPGIGPEVRNVFSDPEVGSAAVVFKTLWRWDKLLMEKGWTAWRVRISRTGDKCRAMGDASGMNIIPRSVKISKAVCWNLGYSFTGQANMKWHQNMPLHFNFKGENPNPEETSYFFPANPKTEDPGILPDLVKRLMGSSFYSPNMDLLDLIRG